MIGMRFVRLVLEQFLGDAPAVEAGHHHVEEDDVGRIVPRELEPGRAVRRLGHVHALGLEVDAAEQPDRRLVIDDEHPSRRPRSRRPHTHPRRYSFSDYDAPTDHWLRAHATARAARRRTATLRLRATRPRSARPSR